MTINHYYKLERLSDMVLNLNKIKDNTGLTRYDCWEANGNHGGIETLKDEKGMLYFHLEVLKKPKNYNPEHETRFILHHPKGHYLKFYQVIQGNNMIFFGEPAGDRFLKDGRRNEFFEYPNDEYFIRVSDTFDTIELFIFQGQLNLNTVEAFIYGKIQPKMKRVRDNTRIYFDYLNRAKND